MILPPAVLLTFIAVILSVDKADCKSREHFACFGQIFEISCAENEHIVFDSAHYGRNDTRYADKCRSPYQRNCDIDVHYVLNRKCAGLSRCSLAVNTKLFGDPCGYEEFLVAKYSCVPDHQIHSTCTDLSSPIFAPGYVSSPSYPRHYSWLGDCSWQLEVQKRQTILLTILDFELDVKKGGVCSDYLQIYVSDRVYFKECGVQGRYELQIDSNKAVINFHIAPNSLTQRGFLLKFTALGPGCPDHTDIGHGSVSYYTQEDWLFANVTCDPGYVQEGTLLNFVQVRCTGSHWSGAVHSCQAPPPLTTPKAVSMTTGAATSNRLTTAPTTIGIALGLVASLLLLLLVVVLVLYCRRRRRRIPGCKDEWRFVVNNLQDNELNEDVYKRVYMHEDVMNKKTNNKEIGTPTREMLLSTPINGLEDMELSGANSPCREPLYYVSPRRNSLGKKRSREMLLDQSVCSECVSASMKQPSNSSTRRIVRSQRDLRSQRRPTRPSPEEVAATCGYPAVQTPEVALPSQPLTQSAPNLVHLVEQEAERPHASPPTHAATFYVPSNIKSDRQRGPIPVPPPKPKPLPRSNKNSFSERDSYLCKI